MVKLITLIFILDAIYLLASGVGIFVGYSQDTLVFALFLPLIYRHWKGLALLPLASILMLPGFSSKYLLLLNLTYLSPWFLVLLPLPLTQDMAHQRLDFWLPYFKWWAYHANMWVGTGPGSFEWVSATQGLDKRMWLHNDWLQLLFEYGVAGLVCGVGLFVGVMTQVRNRIFFVLLAIAMCMYSPLQFWWVQFLIFKEYMWDARLR